MKMNKLSSWGLAAAIAASGVAVNGCGARSELWDPDRTQENGGNAGTGANAGNGGEAGVGGIGGEAGHEGGTGGAGGQGGGPHPTVGTITINNFAALHILNGEEADHLGARFQLEASADEDQIIKGLQLKFRDSACDSTGISGPILLIEEGKPEPIATGQIDDQGWQANINFDMQDHPYLLPKGAVKAYVVRYHATAPCCHSTVEAYLEKPEDIQATGQTFGLPSTIVNQYDETGPHSSYESWAGKFQADFNGPVPINIPVGTEEASCQDLWISNCLPVDVEMKNWAIGVEITNGDETADTRDLIDNNNPPSPNLKHFKIVQKFTDGSYGPTIFGPSELDLSGSDVSQTQTLSGNYMIEKGMGVKAAVVFDVEDNQTLAGNKVRCVLKNLAEGDRVTAEGQPLEDSLVVPNTDETGNIHTFVAEDYPCIHVEEAAVPVGAYIQKGQTNVNFACWDFINACNTTTLRFLVVTHYGVSSYENLMHYRLLKSGTQVSGFEIINMENGKITFNNLAVPFTGGEVTRICINADVSVNADVSSQLGQEISLSQDIVLQPAKVIEGQFPVQGPIFMIVP
jgi:hypothetical protein